MFTIEKYSCILYTGCRKVIEIKSDMTQFVSRLKERENERRDCIKADGRYISADFGGIYFTEKEACDTEGWRMLIKADRRGF